MDIHIIERVVAAMGAVFVGLFALRSLADEWHKTALDDHVAKVMMTLLAIGCVIVLFVALGAWGKI
jgi:hypothetical protein